MRMSPIEYKWNKACSYATAVFMSPSEYVLKRIFCGEKPTLRECFRSIYEDEKLFSGVTALEWELELIDLGLR